jgi:hypothetical protein
VRFFLLAQDERYTNAPHLINWFWRLDVRDIHRKRYRRIPARTVLPIAPDEAVGFLDVLTSPFFLASKVLRDVIGMYDKGIPFRQVVLLDSEHGLAELYYLPILEEVDCLSEESETSPTASVIRRAVFKREPIGQRPIFQIGDGDARHIVVRLDLAESALRRGAKGFLLQPVFFEGESPDSF